MNRRTLLKRMVAGTATAGLATQAASAYHYGECHDPSEDSDCILDDCTDVCPSECCRCIC